MSLQSLSVHNSGDHLPATPSPADKSDARSQDPEADSGTALPGTCMKLGKQLCPAPENRQPEEGREAVPLTGAPLPLRQAGAHCSPGRVCRKERVRLQGLSPWSNHV